MLWWPPVILSSRHSTYLSLLSVHAQTLLLALSSQFSLHYSQVSCLSEDNVRLFMLFLSALFRCCCFFFNVFAWPVVSFVQSQPVQLCEIHRSSPFISLQFDWLQCRVVCLWCLDRQLSSAKLSYATLSAAQQQQTLLSSLPPLKNCPQIALKSSCIHSSIHSFVRCGAQVLCCAFSLWSSMLALGMPSRLHFGLNGSTYSFLSCLSCHVLKITCLVFSPVVFSLSLYVSRDFLYCGSLVLSVVQCSAGLGLQLVCCCCLENCVCCDYCLAFSYSTVTSHASFPSFPSRIKIHRRLVRFSLLSTR